MGAGRDRLRAAWALRTAKRGGGPAANMKVRFRAKGIVVRRALPAICERCEEAMSEAVTTRLETGAFAGSYPSPPLGTVGWRCGCGHVEYVRDDRFRTRVALGLVKGVVKLLCWSR